MPNGPMKHHGGLQTVCRGAVPDGPAWSSYPDPQPGGGGYYQGGSYPQPPSPTGGGYAPSSPGGYGYAPSSPTSPYQQQQQQQFAQQPPAYGQSYSPSSFGDAGPAGLTEPARVSLGRAAGALRRLGWLAFWVQLTMSVVSGVILLFSAAFTAQTGPRLPLYLTLAGIGSGFVSAFWANGYRRIASQMQSYLDGMDVPRVKRAAVIDRLSRGILINVAGMGSTLVGVAALVGLLVSKTLTNAGYGPFAASAAGYNPVLALDVFLVQASVNTLLGHFASLMCGLWMLNVVGEGRLFLGKRPGGKDGEEGYSVVHALGGSVAGAVSGLYKYAGGGGPGSAGSGSSAGSGGGGRGRY